MANTFKFGNGNWAVKDGYALAYNDENNNFKPLPFDFTRASSATRVNKQGLIETVPSGKPRIDFLNNTSGHLLLEPSRTNNMSHSEDFSVYTSAAASRTANAGTSPTGENNATLVYPSSSGSNRGLYKLTATSTTATLSCFVKRSGKNFAILGSDNNSTYYCVFDLENENVAYEATNYTGKIEKYPNGWYRISSTYVSSTAQNYPFIGVADNSSGTVTVDGTNGILIFGMQYEYNSYQTSYIPTEGSSVTRIAETSEINSVPNVPTSYPFVMYVEGNHTLGQESGTCGFYDKSNQYYYYSILFSSNNKVLALSRPQGTENILTSTSTYTDGFHKVAVLFLNDTTVKLYVDGELEATKTDCSNNSFNTSFTDYIIGVFRSISTNSCNIKDFRIFNHELTDTELQALTT